MIKFKPMTSQEEWLWFKERTHVIRCEDTQGIVAFNEHGIRAVVVADSFSVDGCSVHFAIDGIAAIRAGLFREVAYHLFVVCKRERLFGLVPSTNEKALKLDKHIGFEEVARIPDALDTGIDTIVMRMEKSGCRWLPEEIREAA